MGLPCCFETLLTREFGIGMCRGVPVADVGGVCAPVWAPRRHDAGLGRQAEDCAAYERVHPLRCHVLLRKAQQVRVQPKPRNLCRAPADIRLTKSDWLFQKLGT